MKYRNVSTKYLEEVNDNGFLIKHQIFIFDDKSQKTQIYLRDS